MLWGGWEKEKESARGTMGRGKAVSLFPSSPARFLFFRLLQELITRSIQLPYCAYATAFSQVGLFLDKHFLRIAFEKPITSKCVINNKLLIRSQNNSFTLKKKAWWTHVRNLQRILLTVLQATISVFTRKLAVQRKICKTQKSPGRLLHRRKRIIHAKGNRNHLRNSRL